MADNFNLRSFLSENKLTKNSQLLNERDTSRPGTDFDFMEGPGEDPLVAKVMDFLQQNYQEGVDFEYDPNMQRLVIYGELVEDGILVDLIDDVVTQPQYNEEGDLDESLKESTVLNGKPVDLTSIEVDGDYPSDVYIISADFEDGTRLSDEEVQQLEIDYPNLAGEVGFDKQTSGFDYDEDYGVEEAYTPKSKLEQVIQQAWAEPDLEKAKQIVHDLIEPSKVKSKDIILQTIKGINSKLKLDQYLANSLLKFEKLGLNETVTTMTTKEKELVKMVQEAMGMEGYGDDNVNLKRDKQGLPPQQGPTYSEGEEVAEETVIPEYNTIEELMKQIDKGTNRVAEEHKVLEMKKIAKALRGEAQRMEESEHAKHINPKVRKKYLQDAIKIEKAAEKLVAALEKEAKNNKPAAAPKKEEAPVTLAEIKRKRLLKSRILSENKVSLVNRNTNTDTMENFDLKKFLVENKLTTNSKVIKEYIEADEESVAEAFQQAGIDLTQPVHVVETRSVGAGGEQDEPYTVPARRLLAKLEKDRADYNNSSNESGVQYDYDAASYFSAEENGLPENVTAKLSVVFGDEHEYVIFQ